MTNNLELREYILYNFTLIYDFEVSYAMLTTITAKIVSQKNKLQKLFICYSYWLNVLVALHLHFFLPILYILQCLLTFFVNLFIPSDFDMSNAQQEHAFTIEHLAPRLAALRIELCPIHMSEECFWKIYFVLLHPRLNKHDAELLSTPQVKCSSLLICIISVFTIVCSRKVG